MLSRWFVSVTIIWTRLFWQQPQRLLRIRTLQFYYYEGGKCNAQCGRSSNGSPAFQEKTPIINLTTLWGRGSEQSVNICDSEWLLKQQERTNQTMQFFTIFPDNLQFAFSPICLTNKYLNQVLLSRLCTIIYSSYVDGLSILNGHLKQIFNKYDLPTSPLATSVRSLCLDLY